MTVFSSVECPNAFPMNVVVVALALLACGASSQVNGPHPEELVSAFRGFLQTSGKAYSDNITFSHRLDVFASNVAFIESFNANNSVGNLRLGINQFADLTKAEFKEMYLSSTNSDQTPVRGQWTGSSNAVVPERVDWREKGAVTPVKDQKNCGSCWAFSATGAIEGAWFLANGSLVSLSEEELVDCSGGGNRGCAGGDPRWAFKWVIEHQICTEKSYPYTAFQDECHNQFNPCQNAAKIEGYTSVSSQNEVALKKAVAQQPVSVEIEADTDVFRFYKSGVFKDPGCGTALDHAVLAVGYGVQNGENYWLVKNSWNASWGEKGYIRIARTDSTSSSGECGIAMKPVFPTVKANTVIV